MEYRQAAEIKTSDGIEMRAGMQVVSFANKLYDQHDKKVEFYIKRDENTVDACSIMQLSTLAMTCGTRVEVIAKTEDSEISEEPLMNAVKGLVKQLERTDFKRGG